MKFISIHGMEHTKPKKTILFNQRIRSFVKNRHYVWIEYRPNVSWFILTDNINRCCNEESKSLEVLVNCLYAKVGLILMRMLAGIGRHCYTNGIVTPAPSNEMRIVVSTQ
jgi:hypothetical protein